MLQGGRGLHSYSEISTLHASIYGGGAAGRQARLVHCTHTAYAFLPSCLPVFLQVRTRLGTPAHAPHVLDTLHTFSTRSAHIRSAHALHTLCACTPTCSLGASKMAQALQEGRCAFVYTLSRVHIRVYTEQGAHSCIH